MLCCGLRCCTESCGGHPYHINTSDEHLHYRRISDLNYRAVHFGLIEGTTSHGLPHFARARGWCKRTFYFIITILAIGAWAYHTYAILREYLKYDSVMDINVLHAPKLEFPAVTVCNQNAIRKSLYDAQPTLTQWTDGTAFTYYDPEGTSVNDNYELHTEKRERAKERNKVNTQISDIDDDAALYELGHQLEDFIVGCEYNEYECFNGTYTTFYNWQYGNCFTFNSKGNNFISTNTGPIYGLKLTFNVEQDEYVGELTTKAGVRVLIHPKTTMPFPENNGIDVAPGVATAVGIRKVNLKWQGGKYGECVSPSKSHTTINVYESLYPWTTYTREACDKTCFQEQLISNCGCSDTRYPNKGLAIGSLNAAVASCDPSVEAQANCAFTVEQKFENGDLSCGSCKKACSEEFYTRTISTSQWPANNYKTELEAELSTESPELKKIVDDGTLSQNLGYLEIYYEDLNYEYMEEIPAYDNTQFMADFGGAIGLWLGASMITIFEFMEYFLDLWLVCCCRCGGRRNGQPRKSRNRHPKKSTPTPYSNHNSPQPLKRPQTAAFHKKPDTPQHLNPNQLPNPKSDPVMMMYPSPDYTPHDHAPGSYPPRPSPKMAMRPRSNRASRIRPRKAVNPMDSPHENPYDPPDRLFLGPTEKTNPNNDYLAAPQDAYEF